MADEADPGNVQTAKNTGFRAAYRLVLRGNLEVLNSLP